MHKITLEQWRMFIAVVDYGGFAQAGDAIFKTQSTVSHSIKKLESILGKPLFNVVGRKAVLTDFGETLLSSAREVVNRAAHLENEAISNKALHNYSISIAVDTLFPRDILFSTLQKFIEQNPNINIQLHETVLSRCAELLEDGTVDIGITSRLPKGCTSERIASINLDAVCGTDNPLLNHKEITLNELQTYRQIVIRDGGLRSNVDSGWLGSNTRMTVSSLSEAILSLQNNLGYAWLPTWSTQELINQGKLATVNLTSLRTRIVSLNLGFSNKTSVNAVTQQLMSMFIKTFDAKFQPFDENNETD